MKRLLTILFLFASLVTFSQQPFLPSTDGTPVNRPMGISNSSTDARSQFHDRTNFLWRDYRNTTEVLTTLNTANHRKGHVLIFIHNGGTLGSNGLYTGGTTDVYWFKDGVTDGDLVQMTLGGAAFDSIVHDRNFIGKGTVASPLKLDSTKVQKKLVAGEGIVIDTVNNVITSTAGGGSGGTGWYKPTDFAADATGSTNAGPAIQATVDAMPAAGGVLDLQNAVYLINSQVNINKPITIMGSGGGSSLLTTTSATINMFLVTSDYVTFSNLKITNTATTPTAGSAIKVTMRGDGQPGSFTRMQNVDIRNFYDNFNFQDAQLWTIDQSNFFNPVRYGGFVQDVAFPDAGDCSITNCQFWGGTRTCTAGIFQNSSGGLKISNTKFLGLGMKYGYQANFSIAPGTVILMISNSSFEQQDSAAIKIDGGAANLRHVTLTGNQFASYTTTVPYYIDLIRCNTLSILGNTFYANGPEQAIRLQDGTQGIIGNTYPTASSSGYVTTSNFTELTDLNALGVGSWSDISSNGGTNYIKSQNLASIARIENSNVGAAAQARVGARSDAVDIAMSAYSSIFTPNGTFLPQGTSLIGTGYNGMAIYTLDGPLRIATKTNVEKFRFTSNTANTERYLNFGGSGDTSDGYGFRDNAGVMEVKNSSGSWAGMGNSWATLGSNLGVSYTNNRNAESRVMAENGTTGTASQSRFIARSDNADGVLASTSTTFTTSGIFLPDASHVWGTGSNGLALIASNGPIRIATNGTTERFTFDSSGHFISGIGGTNYQTWQKVRAGAASGATGITAMSGSKSAHIYNDGSTIKFSAWNYATSTALPFQIGDDGAAITVNGAFTYNKNENGGMTNFSIPNKKYVDSLHALSGSGVGTVTNVSVVSMPSGFSATTSSSSTTPEITISTNLIGLVNSNGTGFTGITPGSNGNYLKMVSGVPTWVNDSLPLVHDSTLKTENNVTGVNLEKLNGFNKSTSITTSAYTVADGIYTVFCNYTGGTMALTLPAANINLDRRITVKNYSSNNVVVSTVHSGDTNTLVQYAAVTYQSDGTDWNAIMKF